MLFFASAFLRRVTSILNVGDAGNDRYLEALSGLSAETAGLGD